MTVNAIRKFLKHPDCIIFVGSGLSMWSNLPSWSGVLTELAAFLDNEGQSSQLVRREIRNGDLLQAASFGVSKLTPASFGTFIRHAVRFGAATPHAIHKAIVQLGPTGFITTNYDTLIEQALGTWRSDAFFPAPVTNKHLVELADIVRARSSHFIFKPHGDINDVSSIILTREQYRTLMPGGERQSALESLKMLLMTRPVLYVGFGLRDPDFVYLRDLLLNIYQGAVRDHWAIMPDIGDEEVDYWRSQYGIKLFGYETHQRADGSRDHRELLPLLQALATQHDVTGSSINAGAVELSKAERVLALTRYTSGLVRRLTPSNSPVEVRISKTEKTRGIYSKLGLYENWTTTRFLNEGPQPAYLIGLPGSGKSFALRLAAMQLAVTLQQACIDDTLAAVPLTLPVLLDLKLYRGDLRAQIAAELPAGFTLDQLRGSLGLKLFLDAFNEMPSEHLEDGTLFQTLDEMKGEIGDFTYAITSRTPDGLPDRSSELEFYEIDRFEASHVDAILAENGVTLSGAFSDDVRRLLSRPFFLQLVAKQLVSVPANPTPSDLFASFITKLQLAFSERFETDLPLLPIFAKVAYRAIEAESEAFPLAWLSDLVAMQVPDASAFSANDIVNWLIAREVLIPYTGRRASFIHQSITEYCAATELARRSRTDTMSLRDTIASKKWDQCLFLALSLMEPQTADKVLLEAIESDLRLAINAVRYAEEGQSSAITRLLEELIQRAKSSDPERLAMLWLRQLPVGSEHVELLRQLLPLRNSLAGEAVQLIAHILGVRFKSELFELLEAHADDYNFAVNGIARALGPLMDESDLERLTSIAQAWLEKDEESCSAISALMARFKPQALLRAAQISPGIVSPGMAGLLASALSERSDDQSFALLVDLLSAHPEKTTSSFALSLLRNDDGSNEARYHCLDRRHIGAIWSARFTETLWDSALLRLQKKRPDFRVFIESMAEAHEGIEAIALRYCANVDNEHLFVALDRLLRSGDDVLRNHPFDIFSLSNLHWAGRETLLMQNIARDIPKLRKSLVAGLYDVSSLRGGSVDLATMLPALKLLEFEDNREWILRQRIGLLAAHLGDADVRSFCLDALVHGPEHFRNWVKTYYLGSTEGLTSDALDDDMIAGLLSDLNVPNRITAHFYNPLGYIATDRFVQDRLLPLADGASTAFLENLKMVLRTAGDRHGKRYLLPN